MLKKIISNTFANYSLKGIQTLLNLIAIPIFISTLGSEGFALITFANVFVGYFYVFDLGLNSGVTKYVSQYIASNKLSRVSKIVNTTFFSFFLIGNVILLILSIAVIFNIGSYFNVPDGLKSEFNSILIIAGLISLFSWPKLILEGVFKGIQDFVTLNFFIAIGRIFSISLSIIFVKYYTIPIKYIFLLFNIDKIFLFFILYFLLRRKLPFWKFRFSEVSLLMFKKIFSFSGWIMLSNISSFLEYQIDYLVIVTLVGLSSVTDYTIIFYLFHLIQQISGLTASAVLPAVSEVQGKKEKKIISKFIYDGSRYHNLVYIPISMVLYLMSEPFIVLWVGEYYLKYLWLIKLTIVFQVIWQSNALIGNVFYGLGKSKKLGLLALFIGLFNLILSLILVGKFGTAGVVLGTIIIGIISVPFEFYWIFPDLKIRLKTYFNNIYVKIHIPLFVILLLLKPLEIFIKKIDTWYSFIIAIVPLLIMFYFPMYFLLKKDEKVFLKKHLNLFFVRNGKEKY
tara:strand:- start:1257 stop:2786 length:1530 start_codon:yes stop_codon:yes gene_type:complete